MMDFVLKDNELCTKQRPTDASESEEYRDLLPSPSEMKLMRNRYQMMDLY